MKYALFLILLIVFANVANSQPKIQQTSVWAPANIKIDGDLAEWSNKNLSAYNSANRIYYVISNDDDRLYLTVRGSGVAAGSKILKEGIKLTISHSLEKSKRSKDPRNVSVTYPGTPDARIISFVMIPNIRIADFIKDTFKNKKQLDSLTAIANIRVESIAKEIKIQGIKDIKDSVLSIYNAVGIKAAIHFLKGEPIVELAIPLKYLDLTADAPFSYNIKLPAPPQTGNFDINAMQKSGAPRQDVTGDVLYRISDTDLWGEYTLAVKQK